MKLLGWVLVVFGAAGMSYVITAAGSMYWGNVVLNGAIAALMTGTGYYLVEARKRRGKKI